MTLKTDYTGALNTALLEAHTAGVQFVIDNRPALSSALITAATKGQKIFIISLPTSYKFDALRLKGDLLNAYFEGIKHQIEDLEFINSYSKIPIEVNLSLDTSIVTINTVKFSFTFA